MLENLDNLYHFLNVVPDPMDNKCFIAILLIDVLVSVAIIAAGAYCLSKESKSQINNLYLKFKFPCKELQATKTETTNPLQKSVCELRQLNSKIFIIL